MVLEKNKIEQNRSFCYFTGISTLQIKVLLNVSNDKCGLCSLCWYLTLFGVFVIVIYSFSLLCPVVCLDFMGDSREEETPGEGRSIRKQGEQGEQGEKRREGG